MSDESLDAAIDKYLAGAKRKPAAPVDDHSSLDAAIDAYLTGAKPQPQPAPVSGVTPGGPNDPFAASMAEQDQRGREARERKQAEFERKPLRERFSERAYDALARSGSSLATMGSQAIRAVGGARVPGGEYALRKIDQFRANRDAELEARKRSRPEGGLLTQVGEGILEASGPAAAATLLGMAGAPAYLVGGGMSAAGADWRDPKKAAMQTAVGAVAPMVGGRIGSKVGGAVASRLSRPLGQALARGGGEVLGGALGNVGGSAVMGERDPRALVKSALVGGALALPGAAGAGARRAPVTARPTSRLPQGELQGPGRPTSPLPAIENAPTAELPIREILDRPPGLIEAEAKPFGVRANLSLPKSYPGASGPTLEEMGYSVPNNQNPPRARERSGLGSSVGNAFRIASQAMRTIRTSFDLSAPMAQGLFLSRSHPLSSVQAFGKMLRSISPKQGAAIESEILNHPLKPLGDEFGLYTATGGPPEEAFALKQLNRLPGISHSERTYKTYLDSLRLSVWESYVKSLQSDGFTPENNPQAFKDAASFINIATGRGSLRKGGMLEKATELGGVAAFAPRYWVAKMQLLDPKRYVQLAPGARKIVLRDALTGFGTMIGTAALFRAMGHNVGLDPREDDFMTVRFGNHRFDLTSGLKSEAKFLAKLSQGIYNQAEGSGNLPGADPLSVAGRYARGKLAPGPALAYDLAAGQDYTGKKLSEKSAWDIGLGFGPMIAEDLRSGFQDSGMEGLLKSSPAILGQRVSVYPDRAKAQWLETPEGFRQPGEPRLSLSPRRAQDKTEQDETPQQFGSRLGRVNEMLRKYGSRLIESRAYQSATAEEKTAMRDYLRRQIGRDDVNTELLDPLSILSSVRESAYNKRQKTNRR